jgi:hypothetical protein
MPTDYSPQAIATRLKRVEQLRRLCLSLSKAKPKDAALENTLREAHEDYGTKHGSKTSR